MSESSSQEITKTNLCDYCRIEAHAITKDCSVLYLHVEEPMPQEMAEGLWYGPGQYGVVPRGILWYCRTHGFRGAIFDEGMHNRWAFGATRPMEMEKAVMCR